MNTNGIGLGLVISKSIVQQFGGDITFKSTPKIGSVFTFTFKLDEYVNAYEINRNESYGYAFRWKHKYGG